MSQESGIPALSQAPDAGLLNGNVQYQSWLSAMAGGDESALGALYDATLSRVYGLALRITQSVEAAEEILNDVYLQAWHEAGRYEAARGRVITWLLTICRSRAVIICAKALCCPLGSKRRRPAGKRRWASRWT